ncbi:MAG: enamine deaminase RidA [Acidobacteria bacterium]|nr:MAG: enamine deaminase RidA [Acidobacteriota bacterium]
MRTTVVNPPALVRPSGYSHGLLVEEGRRLLFLGGQISWDQEGRLLGGGDFLAQFTRALENLLQVVREAGGGPENIVQMHILVLDKREYLARRREVGEVWRRLMGRHYPAMALLQVAGLLEEEARVEIEGMAVL